MAADNIFWGAGSVPPLDLPPQLWDAMMTVAALPFAVPASLVGLGLGLGVLALSRWYP